MVRCIECAHLNMKEHEKLTAQGFARCPFDSIGFYRSVAIMRECNRFVEAKPAVLSARLEWMDGRAKAWQEISSD